MGTTELPSRDWDLLIGWTASARSHRVSVLLSMEHAQQAKGKHGRTLWLPSHPLVMVEIAVEILRTEMPSLPPEAPELV